MSFGKARPYIVQGLVAVVILLIGVAGFEMFFSSKQAPKRKPGVNAGILVDVVGVEKARHKVKLEATGTVEASRSMALQSEVGGRITWLTPKYYPGGRLLKGEAVARIATDDYAIALSNAKLQLRQKESAFVLEEAKGRAAGAELEQLRGEILKTELSAEALGIVKRVPQLEDALAAVEIAKNNVRQAQLNYDRSVIRMPYDGIFSQTPGSVGELISGGANLGGIVSTESVWVTVSLMPSSLAWLGATPESLSKAVAQVRYEIGGRTVSRPARILSLKGEVEPLGRMAQVILSVDAPFGEPEDAPLLVGTFVNVEIEAPVAIEAVKLPRAYVREGNLAYVCGKDKTLSIRTLTTPYRTADDVYVTDGIEDGERVVTTLISAASDGKKLRVRGEDEAVAGSIPEDSGPGGPPPM